jgi:hypothetical protein
MISHLVPEIYMPDHAASGILPSVHPKTVILGFKLSAVSIQLSAKDVQISQLAEG